MTPHYTATLLQRSVRFQDDLAHVELARGVEVKLRREHLERIALLYAGWGVRLDTNGKGRSYVRLFKGKQRHQLARAVLSLLGNGDQGHRQNRYRNGDALDLTPENLSLGERGQVAGTDATHQETAKLGWQAAQAPAKRATREAEA